MLMLCSSIHEVTCPRKGKLWLHIHKIDRTCISRDRLEVGHTHRGHGPIPYYMVRRLNNSRPTLRAGGPSRKAVQPPRLRLFCIGEVAFPEGRGNCCLHRGSC